MLNWNQSVYQFKQLTNDGFGFGEKTALDNDAFTHRKHHMRLSFQTETNRALIHQREKERKKERG